jgi:hypothetical protein
MPADDDVFRRKYKFMKRLCETCCDCLDNAGMSNTATACRVLIKNIESGVDPS